MQIEAASHNRGLSYMKDLSRLYDQTSQEVDQQIRAWVQRVADNNAIDPSEVRKFLNQKELREFKWNVRDYIKYGEENAKDQKWMKELENASAKVHISRLEAIQTYTKAAMEKLYNGQLAGTEKLLKETYTDSMMKSAYEIQKGLQIGFNVAKPDENELATVLSKPWAVDGLNFSDRIWRDKTKMINELQNELTSMITTGKSPDKSIQNIMDRLNVSKTNAVRLVMTESAYFNSLATKNEMDKMGVDEYEIVATLDSHTSAICRHMDGKHFHTSDYKVGVNAPPFHPHCRSTTVPYFDDDFELDTVRAARNDDSQDASSYYIPSNIKYNEWEDKFVNGGDKSSFEEIPDESGLVIRKLKPEIKRDYNCEVAKKFGKDFYDAARDIFDECKDDNLKKLWELNEAKIKVDSTSAGDKAFAISGAVTMGKKEVIAGSSIQTPYETYFHECAHAIDYIVKDQNMYHFSSGYKNGIFPQTLEQEAMEYINQRHAELKKEAKLHKDDYDWLIKNTISGIKYSKKDAYWAVAREIRSYDKLARGNISDMFEGATEGKVMSGIGHGKAYWKNRTKINGLKDGLATEAFAEMTDASFANKPALDLIKKYFPKSYAIYQEMIESLVKGGGTK